MTIGGGGEETVAELESVATDSCISKQHLSKAMTIQVTPYLNV